MKQYDRVLWDFNGTLLDDLRLCIDCVNLLLTRRGLALVADEEAYRRVFCFPVQAYYGRLGLPCEGEGYTVAAHEWIAAYRAGESTTTLRAGARPVLEKIRAAGIPQGVLSATEAGMLREQVEALGIGEFFESIAGREDIYATDKSDIARAFRRAHPEERILMIGDTLHDADTARAGGFDCVLIEGGHQGRETLLQAGCPVLAGFAALDAWLLEEGGTDGI